MTRLPFPLATGHLVCKSAWLLQVLCCDEKFLGALLQETP